MRYLFLAMAIAVLLLVATAAFASAEDYIWVPSYFSAQYIPQSALANRCLACTTCVVPQPCLTCRAYVVPPARTACAAVPPYGTYGATPQSYAAYWRSMSWGVG